VAAGAQQRQQGEAGLPGAEQIDRQHAFPAWQRGGDLLGLSEITGGEDDGVASQRQLPGELPADAAVGAGDEHDARHRLVRSAGALLSPSSTRRAECSPVQHPVTHPLRPSALKTS
jgi:hypothetical protein